MLTTVDAVTRISPIGSPVLCLDACAILDIVRDPTREKFGTAHARAALELLGWAESRPPALALLVNEETNREITAHLKPVQEEAARHLKKLDATVERALSVIRVIGGQTAADPPRLSDLGFQVEAAKMVERLIRTASLVTCEDVSKVRAMDRVSRGVAPARRGKQSAKDCLIIETYLHVARQLRAAGFAEKVVFLTSNTKDFTSGARSRLHEDLVADFNAVGMTLATDFLMARYALWAFLEYRDGGGSRGAQEP